MSTAMSMFTSPFSSISSEMWPLAQSSASKGIPILSSLSESPLSHHAAYTRSTLLRPNYMLPLEAPYAKIPSPCASHRRPLTPMPTTREMDVLLQPVPRQAAVQESENETTDDWVSISTAHMSPFMVLRIKALIELAAIENFSQRVETKVASPRLQLKSCLRSICIPESVAHMEKQRYAMNTDERCVNLLNDLLEQTRTSPKTPTIEEVNEAYNALAAKTSKQDHSYTRRHRLSFSEGATLLCFNTADKPKRVRYYHGRHLSKFLAVQRSVSETGNIACAQLIHDEKNPHRHVSPRLPPVEIFSACEIPRGPLGVLSRSVSAPSTLHRISAASPSHHLLSDVSDVLKLGPNLLPTPQSSLSEHLQSSKKARSPSLSTLHLSQTGLSMHFSSPQATGCGQPLARDRACVPALTATET